MQYRVEITKQVRINYTIPMKHLAITVTGKVQGVFFRASAKEMADRSGLKGFVRNEKDGSVYIEAEGDDESLRKFIDWCHEGPPHARVSEVSVMESHLKNFSDFDIFR